jgi:DNA (cytosine-5)-methyltransferase 1
LQGNTVAYNEGHTVKLQNKLVLKDAISDLPLVYFILFVVFFIVFLSFFLSIYVLINTFLPQMYSD